MKNKPGIGVVLFIAHRLNHSRCLRLYTLKTIDEFNHKTKTTEIFSSVSSFQPASVTIDSVLHPNNQLESYVEGGNVKQKLCKKTQILCSEISFICTYQSYI